MLVLQLSLVLANSLLVYLAYTIRVVIEKTGDSENWSVLLTVKRSLAILIKTTDLPNYM